ncbi:MAG: hypothetical protein HKP27_08370 [Myxococcales bacterium]|nr:hypothetical protein [Myxococcales bacterium]
MDSFTRPLSKRAARTLYNVADARLAKGTRLCEDFAPAFEAALRYSGVRAARRNWALLCWIERSGSIGLRRRRPFSRLPREERRLALARVENSRFRGIRAALGVLYERIDGALRAAAEERSRAQSS